MTGPRVREWWKDADEIPEAGLPPRNVGEALYDYLERIAVAQGLMEPVRTAKKASKYAPAREPGQEG